MPRLLLLSLVALCLACPRQRVPSPSNDAPPDPNTPEAPDYPPDQRISYQPPYPEEPLGPRVDDAWAATALWLGGLRPGAAWSLVELRPDARLVHQLDAAEGSLDLVKTPPIPQPASPGQTRCGLNGTWTAGDIAESHLVECRPAEYTLTLQCEDGSSETIALTLDGRCDLGHGPNYALVTAPGQAAGGIYLACHRRADCLERMRREREVTQRLKRSPRQ